MRTRRAKAFALAIQAIKEAVESRDEQHARDFDARLDVAVASGNRAAVEALLREASEELTWAEARGERLVIVRAVRTSTGHGEAYVVPDSARDPIGVVRRYLESIGDAIDATYPTTVEPARGDPGVGARNLVWFNAA